MLQNKVNGETVLLMDFDANIEETGAAEHLADLGKTVHWASPVFFNGQDNEDSTVLLPAYQRLGSKNVVFHPMSVMINFENGNATLLNHYLNRTEVVEGIDAIVLTGMKAANDALYEGLKDKVKNLYVIGDATAPRDTAAALTDAMSLSVQI